jgi:hypothetical protein
MLENFKNVQIHGCDEDTGFVLNSSVSHPITHVQLSSSCSVLNFYGIKIASVYLPGGII